MRLLQANIVVISVVSLLGVALLELCVYELTFLINKTDMVFSMFVDLRWLPTLILNLAFIIIFAYPLKRHFEKYALSLKEE